MQKLPKTNSQKNFKSQIEIDPDASLPLTTVELTNSSEVIKASMEVLGTIRVNNRIGLTLDQTVERSGYDSQFVKNFLDVCVAENFIRLDTHTGAYRISHVVMSSLQELFRRGELIPSGAIELTKLKNLIGETALICVDDGQNVTVVKAVYGQQEKRTIDEPGAHLPFHCTSVGKVLLAYMDEQRRDQILAKRFEKLTDKTVTDVAELRAQLEKIRIQGYALADEETTLGVRGIAVPIFESDGRFVASMGIVGQCHRLHWDRVELIADAMMQSADRISERLRSIEKEPRAPASIETLSKSQASYTYSPQWHPEHKKFYWLEQESRSLFRASLGADPELIRTFDTAPDSFVHTTSGSNLVLSGARIQNITTGREYVCDSSIKHAVSGINDEIWAITERDGHDMLVNLTTDGRATDHAAMPMGVSSICYCAIAGVVYALNAETYTLQSYKLISRRLTNVRTFTPAGGKPNRITIDRDWNLWVSFEGGWFINALSLEGETMRRCPVQIPAPTGLCFGGETGRDLVVTSLSTGLDPYVLRNAPLSGHVVSLRMEGDLDAPHAL